MGPVVFDAVCVAYVEAYWDDESERHDNKNSMIHMRPDMVNVDRGWLGVRGSVKQVMDKLRKALSSPPMLREP
ncbi:MAG TPA: hypothetical protein VGK73_31455 [Polyangiaceae bacterium]